MRWRDVIIGFISALLVTILGGVGVYYFTQERPPKQPIEQLVYKLDSTAEFTAKNNSFNLVRLKVANLGNQAANNTNIGIVFDEQTAILDKSINLSSGPVGIYKITKEDTNALIVQLPILAPEEIVTISLMLNHLPQQQPKIGVKSERTTGVIGEVVRVVDKPKSSERDTVLNIMMPLLILMQLGAVLFLRRKMKRYGKNVNNTAFLYIHQGLHNTAKGLIEQEINKDGADGILLTNYALCFALTGDFKNSELQLAAAGFLSTRKHEKAVLKFNQALIALLQGHCEVGEKLIAEAIKLSHREILKYCSFSIIVKSLRAKYQGFDLLLKKAQEKGRSSI